VRLSIGKAYLQFAAHIISDDEGFKIDLVSGTLHGFEHCGMGSLAIGEESDFGRGNSFYV